MAFDTSAPLISYKLIFNGYRDRVSKIMEDLNASFNFGLNTGASNYGDYWEILMNVSILKYYTFDDKFTTIQEDSQTLNNTLETRYMDYIGMMMALDNYMCYAVDAFSRIADSIWSFGDGQIYTNKTGALLENGEYEIIRKGLQYYLDSITSILSEMEDYISTDPGPTAAAKIYGMSKAKYNDETYLTYKKEQYFIPKVMEISSLLEAANVELLNIITYLNQTAKALNVWFTESFKLVSYIGLAFNLSKKAETVANKIISFSGGVTTTSIIAVNSAKFWKKQVLADQSNRNQCFLSAMETGLTALTYPSMLQSYIDDSWDLMIPKYGL